MASRVVEIRALPEAVLGSDTADLEIAGEVTTSSVVDALAAMSPSVGAAMKHDDGTVRASTRVLVDGVVLPSDLPISPDAKVTVISVLPCDG